MRPENQPHVYDANLDADADKQVFFEDSNLAVATRFFRNLEMFAQLVRAVIPQLLQGGLASRRILRVWSAGCSDGRESYSLAISARRALDDAGHSKVDVLIRGSDLSRPQLEIARKGEYKISKGDAEILEPYAEFFHRDSDEIWRVGAPLKKMIHYEVEDITAATPEEPYDVVVCSLVLLYYEPEYQKKIVQHLISTLREDGFLYTVPVNRRWLKRQGLFPVEYRGPFFRRAGLGQITVK